MLGLEQCSPHGSNSVAIWEDVYIRLKYFSGTSGAVLVVGSFLSLVPNISSRSPAPSLIPTLRIRVTWTAIQLAFTVCSPKGPNPEKTVKASCHRTVALPSLPRARLLPPPGRTEQGAAGAAATWDNVRGLSLVLGQTQWCFRAAPLPHTNTCLLLTEAVCPFLSSSVPDSCARQKASGLLLPQKRLALLPSQLSPLCLTQCLIILSLSSFGASPLFWKCKGLEALRESPPNEEWSLKDACGCLSVQAV